MANIRATGEIEPMQWGIPVPELTAIINNLAEKAGCDSIRLVAATPAAALINVPAREHTAIRTFDAYGFDFRNRLPEPRRVT
jgi:hypothetical protein